MRDTYGLVLQLEKPREIVVGWMGRFIFPAGYYLYVGGALWPGGLEARLARHLLVHLATRPSLALFAERTSHPGCQPIPWERGRVSLAPTSR